jgi:hypothetical protein
MGEVHVPDRLTRLIQDLAARKVNGLGMAFKCSELLGREGREQLVVHG